MTTLPKEMGGSNGPPHAVRPGPGRRAPEPKAGSERRPAPGGEGGEQPRASSDSPGLRLSSEERQEEWASPGRPSRLVHGSGCRATSGARSRLSGPPSRPLVWIFRKQVRRPMKDMVTTRRQSNRRPGCSPSDLLVNRSLQGTEGEAETGALSGSGTVGTPGDSSGGTRGAWCTWGTGEPWPRRGRGSSFWASEVT